MLIEGNVKWVSIMEPNTTFEPCYQASMIVDKKTADEFEALGIKTRTDNDGDLLLTFKRKTTKADGTAMRRPVQVDLANQPLNELIGNGSLARIQYAIRDWEWGKKTGKKLDLQGIQVIEHVPYGGVDGGEFKQEAAPKDFAPQSDGGDNKFDDDDVPFE